MNELDTLAAAWSAAKTAEGEAVEKRRAAEDRIVALLAIPESKEGTTNASTDGGMIIKIVGRLNRKVDTDALIMLAAENGLSVHLSSLVRWSADINAAAWKAAAAAITAPLMGAITTTAGRPSFTISIKDK